MAGLTDLMREYERVRYPDDRRLDLQAEGPETARERALRFIQSRAHEMPGEEYLIVITRGSRPGQAPSAVEREIRTLLDELKGKLVDWWAPFAPGSLALRIAMKPSMLGGRGRSIPSDDTDGRTGETAGVARPDARADIPPELLELAVRVAEQRLEREGLSQRILDVMLREIWIEAQAVAMESRITFEEALLRIRQAEMQRHLDD